MIRRIGYMILTGALLLGACDSNPTEVPPMVVSRVEVGPTGSTIAVGESMRLHAYPKTADGTILGSVQVDWTADVPDIVNLSATGLVTALKPGNVEITATAAGKTGRTTVTVVAAPVAIDRIEISPPVTGMTVGQQQTLEARIFAADGTQIGGRTVTWTTSHAGRATVAIQGDSRVALLTALTVGEVTIKAAVEGKSASFTFTVVAQPAPTVGSVIVTPAELTAWVGNSRTFTAHVLSPGGGPIQNAPPVAWSVSSTAVAEVGANGVVKALRVGNTQVTATAGGKSGSARLYVYPLPSDSMTFTVQPNVDAAGNPRITPSIGQKIWYDANGAGHNATMWVQGAALKLVHSGPTGRYTLTWRIALIAEIGGHGQTVATEFVDEAGTYGVVYDMNTGMPVYQLVFPTRGSTENARWTAPGRLVLPIAVGTAPRQDWLWTQVF